MTIMKCGAIALVLICSISFIIGRARATDYQIDVDSANPTCSGYDGSNHAACKTLANANAISNNLASGDTVTITLSASNAAITSQLSWIGQGTLNITGPSATPQQWGLLYCAAIPCINFQTSGIISLQYLNIAAAQNVTGLTDSMLKFTNPALGFLIMDSLWFYGLASGVVPSNTADYLISSGDPVQPTLTFTNIMISDFNVSGSTSASLMNLRCTAATVRDVYITRIRFANLDYTNGLLYFHITASSVASSTLTRITMDTLELDASGSGTALHIFCARHNVTLTELVIQNVVANGPGAFATIDGIVNAQMLADGLLASNITINNIAITTTGGSNNGVVYLTGSVVLQNVTISNVAADGGSADFTSGGLILAPTAGGFMAVEGLTIYNVVITSSGSIKGAGFTLVTQKFVFYILDKMDIYNNTLIGPSTVGAGVYVLCDGEDTFSFAAPGIHIHDNFLGTVTATTPSNLTSDAGCVIYPLESASPSFSPSISESMSSSMTTSPSTSTSMSLSPSLSSSLSNSPSVSPSNSRSIMPSTSRSQSASRAASPSPSSTVYKASPPASLTPRTKQGAGIFGR